MTKTRMNISIDKDLADFAKAFASENRTTVAEIITQYILSLKRSEEGELTKELFANPIFSKAMAETQIKLKTGNVKWHTFEEVFGEE